MKHTFTGRIYSGDEITWRSKRILSDLRIGFCEVCGFFHADPYPSENFLSEYYQYYEIPCPLHSQERDRIAKLLLKRVSPSSPIIDIGCGKGEMLSTLLAYGFKNLYGTEFGSMYDESKKLETINVLPYNLVDLCGWCQEENKSFECAILINVFEHVPEPINMMEMIKKIISPSGILMFIVPNDFSTLQSVYLEKTKRKPWFLTLPDHINFFSLNTIDKVVEKAGYEVLHKTVQYPLEFFLLQGDDYIAMPELGKMCHQKRVEFERSFTTTDKASDLEAIYNAFARVGIGRDMYIVARSV